jgi:hypothetical protein
VKRRVRAKAAWVVAVTAVAVSIVAFVQPAVALTMLGVLTLVTVTMLLATAARSLVTRIPPASDSPFDRRPHTSGPTEVPPNLQSLVTLASVNQRAELPGTIRRRIVQAADSRLRTHHALDLRNPADRAAINGLVSPLMRAALAGGPDAPRLAAEVLPRLLDELESL